MHPGTMPPRRRVSWQLAGSGAALALGSLLAALAGCQAPGAVDASSGNDPIRVTPQRDWSDAVIYFVLVDRFADGDADNNLDHQPDNPGGWHGGDLKGLAGQLDEIARLGATAIWINPVQTQIDVGLPVDAIREAGVNQWFEHWGFHGYWMDDFTSVDPHFGSEADLAALVEAAHERGLKVLLDVVYNHSGYGSRYTTDPAFEGWVRPEQVNCDADPVRCQVGGLPDFRTERDEVADYLLDANLGLAARTGVDGFRLDTAKHVTHEFWQSHRQRATAELGEHFFLLAEVWGGSAEVMDPYFESDEVDAGFDFTFRGSCRDFVEGRMRAIAYSAYLERRHRVRDGYHLAHYLSSHDEPLFLHELGGDVARFRLCVATQMATLGIPVIYYGEEVGRKGSVWPTNRNDMPWGDRDVEPGAGVPRDEALRDWYQRLIALRRAHPALSRGTYTRLHADGDLLVFRREDAGSGDAAVVAVNRGQTPAEVVVAIEGWAGGIVEGLSGEAVAVTGEGLRVQVPGLGVRIYLAADRRAE